MAIITEYLVREILLDGRAGPRLLNESAVQVEVWSAFATRPGQAIDLLLTPLDSTPAPRLARTLHLALIEVKAPLPRHIAPLEANVAARLSFDDFLCQVLPLTGLDVRASFDDLILLIGSLRASRGDLDELKEGQLTALDLFRFAEARRGTLPPDLRTALLAMMLLVAREIDAQPYRFRYIEFPILSDEVVKGLRDLPLDPRRYLKPIAPVKEALIWRVAINRPVLALGISVETIKADAAHRVFEIDCRALTWAVIDSGIDGAHPSFRDHDAGGFATRIDKAYDFGRLRTLASFDALANPDQQSAILGELQEKLLITGDKAAGMLARLRDDAERGRPYDWELLSALLEVATDKLEPGQADRPDGHGTHVAGVLAGDWRENGKTVLKGVCPNLRIYDLRVLGATTGDTEFAVIAALEFVRWLNSRNRYMTIHGVNLSIGLVHDSANYACGRTPVCLACEVTVAEGVTVVAAAGNWGSHTYSTLSGDYVGYAAISIADPGNAASVITVGATHRERPHEYGVSYFSSRGPTADGRAKPDVVAPGERIDGPLPNLGLGRLDGTSMAAPHVSGTAALLMARYPEMIGDPARVKSVIIQTATDLGRERHFQGAGLVDALRALQAV